MIQRLLIQLQRFHDLRIALEDLDCVPALLLFRHIVYTGFFDVCQCVLHTAAEGMHRNRLSALCGFYSSFSRCVDIGSLQSRDADELHTHLFRQLFQINLIPVLLDQIHHVDGYDNRNAQLCELGCQIEVSLQVRTINDIQDSIRPLCNQVFSRNDFFQCVRGE